MFIVLGTYNFDSRCTKSNGTTSQKIQKPGKFFSKYFQGTYERGMNLTVGGATKIYLWQQH